MMVVTAKVKKRKILIIFAAIIAIIATLLIPGKKEKNSMSVQTNGKIETNEQRIAFLSSMGWDVEDSPIDTQTVIIPTEESEVYRRYNELQKSQGYDLNNYTGKTAKRYVYKVKNHPDATGTYHATILICNGQIIGGDVASTEVGGRMHSLQRTS